MGWFAAAAPYIMTGLGMVAQHQNTVQTQKKADGELARHLAAITRRNQESDAQANALIDKRTGSTSEDERASSLASMQQRMAQQRQMAAGSLDQVGGVSDAYKESANDAALGIGQYGGKIADMLSRIDAPTQQRQNEALENVRFGTEMNTIARLAQSDDFLHKLRMSRIRRNPGLDLAAGALQGAGGAMAGGGGWGGAFDAGTAVGTVNNGSGVRFYT
ncbi:hypothetical protein [Lysobacter olei]